MRGAATSRRAGVIGVAFLAALALALVGVAQTQAGHSLLKSAGLNAKPDRYTELAFADSRQLPTTLASSSVPVRVSLRNEEGSVRDYRWTIAATSGAARRVLASGSVRAWNGQALELSRSVRVPCHATRARISVELARPAQSIGFWVACPPRTSTRHG
jgi:hypothetical protein